MSMNHGGAEARRKKLTLCVSVPLWFIPKSGHRKSETSETLDLRGTVVPAQG